MAVRVEKKQGVSLVILDNDSLVREIAQELKDAVNKLIDNGERKIHLDLSRTEFADSSGVGKLLFLNRKMKDLGGDFAIAALSQRLQEFFKSLALDSAISFPSK